MFGFLKRNSKDFKDPIWNPIFECHSLRIENVQRNFTRFIFSRLNWGIDRLDYTTRCALFGLPSLSCRRKFYSVMFIRDLIHKNINCPALLECVQFYAPLRSLNSLK